MLAILVDECIDGSAELLANLADVPEWTEFRASLDLQFFRFRDIGLETGTKDDVIWELCQSERYILITENRKGETPDSLGEMIRTRNNRDSLSVLTIGSIKRLENDPQYRADVIEQLYEYIIDLENYLGTGRLYLP